MIFVIIQMHMTSEIAHTNWSDRPHLILRDPKEQLINNVDSN